MAYFPYLRFVSYIVLKFVGVSSKHLRVFLESLRQSSEILGKSWKMFGNVRLVFGTILENLRKSSEGGRKSSENHRKRRHQHVYIIQRFKESSRGKNNILLAALVRKILFCHSKIKFISSHHRVIFSIYLAT